MSRYRIKRWLFAIALSLTLFTQACQSWGISHSRRSVVLTGSSTVAPLMVEIAERYRILHPKVDIQITTGGSNQGILDVTEGRSDIGMASRALRPEESEGVDVFTIAQDGIAMLVHRSNPVRELSQEQIQQIYQGGVGQWSELGGVDQPLVIVSKTQQHATFDLFVDYFGLQAAQINADVVVGDNADMIQTVLDEPNAIGYVSIGAAEYEIVHGLPLKLLPLLGTKATIANVRQGGFPLSRPLNLITQPTVSDAAQDFIDYALSDTVHDLVEQKAFVPAN